MTGSLVPILHSSSLLMLPEQYANKSSYSSAPISVTISPVNTPCTSVMSIESWSMQMRPTIGTIWLFINTLPFPFEKFLGKPSPYPIGMIAILLSRLATKSLPYPTLSPLLTCRIDTTRLFNESTGRRPSFKFVSSFGELKTPYNAIPTLM